jgi:hypothetical protein
MQDPGIPWWMALPGLILAVAIVGAVTWSCL